MKTFSSSVVSFLPANEAVNLSKKNNYAGYTRFQVLPKVDLNLSFKKIGSDRELKLFEDIKSIVNSGGL